MGFGRHWFYYPGKCLQLYPSSPASLPKRQRFAPHNVPPNGPRGGEYIEDGSPQGMPLAYRLPGLCPALEP
jgi:hypothetical protein